MKLTKEQLKQIVLEELEEIRTDGRGFGAAQMATAKALSSKGVASKPESVRTRLMQLVADLDLENPTESEVKELADMISSLMDAAGDADQYGLEESHSKEDEKELEKIVGELEGASKMHKSQAERIQKILDQTDDKELKEEEDNEPVSEGMNCGCGKDPCETFGPNSEKIAIFIAEEIENYLEESLYYGLVEESNNLEEKKKKKKACKPSKGKKFARRVKGKCVSYGQAGKAKGGGARIKPGTGKGNAYCARSYGDMKSHGKDCSGKDRGTPLCLSRQKWKCSGKYSRKGK